MYPAKAMRMLMPKPSKTKKKIIYTQCDCLAPAVFCKETCWPAVNASCRYFCYIIMQHSVGNRKHVL